MASNNTHLSPWNTYFRLVHPNINPNSSQLDSLRQLLQHKTSFSINAQPFINSADIPVPSKFSVIIEMTEKILPEDSISIKKNLNYADTIESISNFIDYTPHALDSRNNKSKESRFLRIIYNKDNRILYQWYLNNIDTTIQHRQSSLPDLRRIDSQHIYSVPYKSADIIEDFRSYMDPVVNNAIPSTVGGYSRRVKRRLRKSRKIRGRRRRSTRHN
jgi:hypothetical protein